MNLLDDIKNTCDALEDGDMNDLLDWCFNAEDEGSHYPGMTYEQGIRDVINWLSGESSHPPHKD